MTQFAFRRTGDDDYPKYLKVLLQGPPKSGKTVFISTAPNVVVAACEAGLASIAHLNVPYVNVDGTEKLQNLEMILRDDTLRDHAAKQLGMTQIETVAIDTLDAWQEMLKKEILAENRRSQMQQADWGTLKERMSVIMKRYVTLPVNVIFTVHTSTTQDEESRMVYAPALQGSIKDEIAGYVDFSLLSFRQRETAKDGTAKISYYLKCEGDQKNPHLGNRAAGRLPEIVAPKFSILHDAVFGAATTSTEDVAQQPSQIGIIRVVQLPEPTPTGVPEDDPAGPINASGIAMLTKAYIEQGLTVPEDLNGWNLEKARIVARWFMAWKADKLVDANSVSREDLVGGLKDYEAFTGEMKGVQTGVENLKPSRRGKPNDNATVDKPVASVDDPAEVAAMRLLQEQLGAVEITPVTEAEVQHCGECGYLVDDEDIAHLAVIKFKTPLCVAHYKDAVKTARQ